MNQKPEFGVQPYQRHSQASTERSGPANQQIWESLQKSGEAAGGRGDAPASTGRQGEGPRS